MYCFTNAKIFDGRDAMVAPGLNVYVKGDRIHEISDRPPNKGDGTIYDCTDKTLMPGFVDAHIHAYASRTNLIQNDLEPITFVTQYANSMLSNMLSRGFTTVRDCGGADHGLANALSEDIVKGPDLYYCGKMLSQKGGHGDLRNPYLGNSCLSCGCGYAGHLSTTADGVDEVVRAVRENFRQGASFIKFAGSGGVSSQTGSITALQYSDAEVSAIVSECERHERYCTAHIHPDAAIKRAIDLGVHCIEHATLIDSETAKLAADKGTFIVPTASIVHALKNRGEELGLSAYSLSKLNTVSEKMLEGFAYMKEAGVGIGFGTDLLGPLESEQFNEFHVRSSVFSHVEILRQATSVNAKLMQKENEIGAIKVDAYANIIVIEGNPLADIGMLREETDALGLIMKRGKIHKNKLPELIPNDLDQTRTK